MSNLTYLDKDGVTRFKKTDDNTAVRLQAKEFSKLASEGKILCISDLIGNAENAYIKNMKRSK